MAQWLSFLSLLYLPFHVLFPLISLWFFINSCKNLKFFQCVLEMCFKSILAASLLPFPYLPLLLSQYMEDSSSFVMVKHKSLNLSIPYKQNTQHSLFKKLNNPCFHGMVGAYSDCAALGAYSDCAARVCRASM